MAQIYPVFWDGIPCVLHAHDAPMWREGRCEGNGGSDDEDREQKMEHEHLRPTA